MPLVGCCVNAGDEKRAAATLVAMMTVRIMDFSVIAGGLQLGVHSTQSPTFVATRNYWITSSAVANNVSEMVSPSALAVLRLMTNSYLVG